MAAINSFNYAALSKALVDALEDSGIGGPPTAPAVQPVTFDVTDIQIHKVTTAVVGTDWVDAPDAPARVVIVRNDSSDPLDPAVGGAHLEVRYNGAGQTFRVNINSAEPLPVVEDASELSFRRVDVSNTPVTFTLQVVN